MVIACPPADDAFFVSSFVDDAGDFDLIGSDTVVGDVAFDGNAVQVWNVLLKFCTFTAQMRVLWQQQKKISDRCENLARCIEIGVFDAYEVHNYLQIDFRLVRNEQTH